MTMAEAGECPYAATDTAVLYLARSLSESRLEAFEEHLFSCERCLNETRVGLEIRAAAQRSSGLAGPGLRRVAWRPLAIAAALAAVLIGAWQFQRSKGPAADAVTRGDEARALAVRARSVMDGLELSWRPVPRADVYRVEISSSEGTLLLKREVPGATLSVRRDELAASAGGALYVRVSALDSLRQEIVSSSPVSIDAKPRKE